MDTPPRKEILEEHGKRSQLASQLRLTARSGLKNHLKDLKNHRLTARSGLKNHLKDLKNQFPSPWPDSQFPSPLVDPRSDPSPWVDPRSGPMPTNKWQGNLMVNTKGQRLFQGCLILLRHTFPRVQV